MNIGENLANAIGYIALAVAAIFVASFLFAGCKAYNEGQQETKRICISSGGTWVSGACADPDSKVVTN